MSEAVYIVSGCRTAIGRFGGSLTFSLGSLLRLGIGTSLSFGLTTLRFNGGLALSFGLFFFCDLC